MGKVRWESRSPNYRGAKQGQSTISPAEDGYSSGIWGAIEVEQWSARAVGNTSQLDNKAPINAKLRELLIEASHSPANWTHCILLSFHTTMFGATVQLGLRHAALPRRSAPFIVASAIGPATLIPSSARRNLSSRALQASPQTSSIAIRRSPTCFVPRQSNTPTSTPSSFFTPSLCRHASTTAYPSASHTAASTTHPQSPASRLDWNTFFKLRKSRRRYSLVFSVVCALGAFAACGVSISLYQPVADFIAQVVPLDPFVSMGIVTFAAALLGWLIGPFFGNGLWRLLHRGSIIDFMSKERGFFERIKRHRVDPQGASTNNPVPDYYGEKVGSVEGYRRWLKDQRAFNRKRSGNFV